MGTAGLGQYTCLHASRKCIKGNPGPSPRGMFYARGTGEPQMVNRRGASHCLSPVPISRLLGDIPAAPYLLANREMASSGRSHSSSVAVLSRSSGWHGTASARAFDAAVGIMCLESAVLDPRPCSPTSSLYGFGPAALPVPIVFTFPSLQTASSKCLSSNASRAFYSVEKPAQPTMSRRCGDEGGRVGGIGRHSEYSA